MNVSKKFTTPAHLAWSIRASLGYAPKAEIVTPPMFLKSALLQTYSKEGSHVLEGMGYASYIYDSKTGLGTQLTRQDNMGMYTDKLVEYLSLNPTINMSEEVGETHIDHDSIFDILGTGLDELARVCMARGRSGLPFIMPDFEEDTVGATPPDIQIASEPVRWYTKQLLSTRRPDHRPALVPFDYT